MKTVTCPSCRGSGQFEVVEHEGVAFDGDPPKKYLPFMEGGVLNPNYLDLKILAKLLPLVKKLGLLEQLLGLEAGGLNRPTAVARITNRIGELSR